MYKNFLTGRFFPLCGSCKNKINADLIEIGVSFKRASVLVTKLLQLFFRNRKMSHAWITRNDILNIRSKQEETIEQSTDGKRFLLETFKQVNETTHVVDELSEALQKRLENATRHQDIKECGTSALLQLQSAGISFAEIALALECRVGESPVRTFSNVKCTLYFFFS